MGLKDIKKDIIIGAALELFLKGDINSVTIKQISDYIEVGEATMYRYFANKQNIINLCAQKLGKNVFKDYFNLDEFRTGFNKMEEFYNNFLYVFKEHPEYYRFINDFDIYMFGETTYNLTPYEDFIDKFKDLYMAIYKEGVADGTINKVNEIEVYYYEVYTEETPIIKNTSYTSNEKEGNFELRYIPLKLLKEEIEKNAKTYGDKHGIAKEMIDLLNIYMR